MNRLVHIGAAIALCIGMEVVSAGPLARPAVAHGSCSFTATQPLATLDGIRGSGWIQCSYVHDVYSMTVCIEFRAAVVFEWDKLGCSSYSVDNANSSTFVRYHTEPCFEPGFYRTWIDGSVGSVHTTPPVVSGDSGILHACAPI